MELYYKNKYVMLNEESEKSEFLLNLEKINPSSFSAVFTNDDFKKWNELLGKSSANTNDASVSLDVSVADSSANTIDSETVSGKNIEISDDSKSIINNLLNIPNILNQLKFE